MLAAPLAELFEFDFSLHLLSISVGIVIPAFARRTAQADKMI